MLIKQYDLNESSFYESLTFMPSIAWIDIETDGLSHKNELVIIGLILFTKDIPHGRLIQLFNDDGKSEFLLIEAFLGLLNAHRTNYFISFNGNAFDLPFLNARLSMHGFNQQLNKKFNIDLLKIARHHKAKLPIEKLNLKAIESFLNIPRNDTISGKESIEMYKAYLRTKDSNIRETILLHNYDDLINMIPLLGLLDILNVSINALFQPLTLLINEKWMLQDYYISDHHLTVVWSQFYYLKNHHNRIDHIGVAYEYALGNMTCKFLLKTFHDNLYVMDTDAIFHKDFNSYSNTEKQLFVVYNQSQFYLNNILSIFNDTEIQKQIKTLLS